MHICLRAYMHAYVQYICRHTYVHARIHDEQCFCQLDHLYQGSTAVIRSDSNCSAALVSTAHHNKGPQKGTTGYCTPSMSLVYGAPISEIIHLRILSGCSWRNPLFRPARNHRELFKHFLRRGDFHVSSWIPQSRWSFYPHYGLLRPASQSRRTCLWEGYLCTPIQDLTPSR